LAINSSLIIHSGHRPINLVIIKVTAAADVATVIFKTFFFTAFTPFDSKW